MSEETLDFFEEQAEKGLVCRTGRTRALSKPALPSRKECLKMNGPVIAKQLPQYGSLRARLQYLMGTETQAEFAKKCGVAEGQMSRYMRGQLPRAETMKRIATACDVPVKWLIGSEEQGAESVKPEPTQERREGQSGFAMSLNGEYSGAVIARYVSGLSPEARYNVRILVTEAKE